MADRYCGVKVQTAAECAAQIESGDQIWIPPVQSVPIELVDAIVARADDLRGVDIWGAMTLHEFPFMRPGLEESFQYHSFFLSPVERKLRHLGAIDAMSISYTYLRETIQEVMQPNVIVTEVSLPEPDGTVCFGPTGGGLTALALPSATKILLQINPNVPFIYGDNNSMNIKDATGICESETPLIEGGFGEPSEMEKQIGAQILPYVQDGDVIQLGLGGLSQAIGYGLMGKKDLGVHSEMFTDSMMALMKEGTITNTKKTFFTGESVFGFTLGSRELYSFLDHNPAIHQRLLSDVNNPYEIAKNNRLISINACIAVDLTGQVASEAFGFRQISGTGGSLDFTRGARKSSGGRSFNCLASSHTDRDGNLVSNILPALPEGTPVTVPRTDVDCVATEYGIADLANRPFSDRARALIAISHPDLREELTDEATRIGIFPPRK